MEFIVDNKEWLFSGAGITAIFVIFKLTLELYGLGWKYRIDGYYIPNSLSYFSHSGLVNGRVNVKSKRIISVRAVRNRNITIDYPINTVGKINKTLSLSDPGVMKIVEPGQNSGKNSINIKAKKNAQYIVASESERDVSPFEANKAPAVDNLVIYTLHRERLINPQRDFVGARVVGKTETQRIVVEFSAEYKPKFVHVIQIDSSGEIIRDEKSLEFIKASHEDGTLYVVDLHSPEKDSGIYLWWEWPNS